MDKKIQLRIASYFDYYNNNSQTPLKNTLVQNDAFFNLILQNDYL